MIYNLYFPTLAPKLNHIPIPRFATLTPICHTWNALNLLNEYLDHALFHFSNIHYRIHLNLISGPQNHLSYDLQIGQYKFDHQATWIFQSHSSSSSSTLLYTPSHLPTNTFQIPASNWPQTTHHIAHHLWIVNYLAPVW